MTVDEAPKARWRRRLKVLLNVVTALVALAAVVVGFKVWRSEVKGQPVAAAFTRVGGRTRIETAVEASRFWRSSLPGAERIVTTWAYERQDVLWGAARCAARNDVPLLFTALKRKRPLKGKQRQLVRATIRRLAGNRRPKSVIHRVIKLSEVKSCLLRHGSVEWSHHHAIPYDPILLPAFKPQETLARVVVFAARKAPKNAPDVAVGLTLAAHMARVRKENKAPDQTVSLVIVPRYLEASPRLEDQLREQPELVKSGLVVGQTKIFSDDLRPLLRELLTPANRQGILGALQDNLGSVQTLLAALLALIAVETATRVLPELVVLMGRNEPDRPAPPRPPLDRNRPIPLQIPSRRRRERMRPLSAWPFRFRSLLGLLGAAVIIYGCVILWWHANALATILIVGAVLLILAFILDRESIVPIRDDRSEHSRKQAERRQDAVRELTRETLKRLLAPDAAPLESAAIPQHVLEDRELFLELTKPLQPPTRAVCCRIDTPADKHFYLIPDIEAQRAAGRLTYRAAFPGALRTEGIYNVQWFELSDDLTRAAVIGSDSFEIALSPPRFL